MPARSPKSLAHRAIALPVALLLACFAAGAPAQDLYDPATLRTFALTFHDADWEARLRANYVSQTDILADLVVDGTTYPNVGVRIRGNTSYTALPAGSQKFSLKIDMQAVDPEQELLGYDTINLNNGFHDPTFSREVVYNNFAAQFIPNGRANNVVVTLNGANWGVYNNIQQGDKKMLGDYFADNDGLRISCANNPNGPGLRYNGPTAAGYPAYEIQNDGGLPDPYAPLIDVANALTNEPLATWQNIDTRFAIDPSIWSVAIENFLTDDDSYVNKGCDFTTYRDPIDGRMHLLQRDANEAFTQAAWSPTRNFTMTSKPVLSRVLAVAELRQRYFAHYRTLLRHLTWAEFEPVFIARRDLLDAAVQADPKRIYTHAHFTTNFHDTVNLPQPGLAGGVLIGLEEFVTQRAASLAAVPEIAAQGPTIASAQASDASPDPSATVVITATVTPPAGSGIQRVELFHRPTPTAGYLRTAMRDDGASGDGAAGDGVYGATLPVTASAGQRVQWYVGAAASNAFQSLTFAPELAERGPNTIAYTFGATGGMRITEWMYGGANGEFVELTNVGTTPVDMTGWSLDDAAGVAGTFALGAFGTVAPGESVVVTEAIATAFATAWSLAPTVKVIGELGVTTGHNYGRNDAITLFDAGGALVDRLAYGDQDFVGTIRTNNASGQPPCGAIGQDDVTQWQLSVVGDAFGSRASAGNDVGNPGASPAAGCVVIDAMFDDGFETITR